MVDAVLDTALAVMIADETSSIERRMRLLCHDYLEDTRLSLDHGTARLSGEAQRMFIPASPL